jgi:hypothetical protein
MTAPRSRTLRRSRRFCSRSAQPRKIGSDAPPRTDDEREQLYEAAAALLRLAPQRTDAAQILIDGLDGSDEDIQSFAAPAVRDVGPLDRGAGPSLLRARLRAELKVPDAYNFFVLDGQLCALSRRAFLKGCEGLLGHREWWVRAMAAERLVRYGGPRERARVLAWASGKGFGSRRRSFVTLKGAAKTSCSRMLRARGTSCETRTSLHTAPDRSCAWRCATAIASLE